MFMYIAEETFDVKLYREKNTETDMACLLWIKIPEGCE